MRTEGHDRVERVGGVRPPGSSPTTRSCSGKTKPPGPATSRSSESQLSARRSGVSARRPHAARDPGAPAARGLTVAARGVLREQGGRMGASRHGAIDVATAVFPAHPAPSGMRGALSLGRVTKRQTVSGRPLKRAPGRLRLCGLGPSRWPRGSHRHCSNAVRAPASTW